ncbi:MAG: ABC transporter ATP-binding protein [Oscillospiraceae bacterium]|nr:ABC transporter ATP-binding protein [Oscillospiraceae bacterium]
MKETTLIGSLFKGKIRTYVLGILCTALASIISLINPLIISFVIDHVLGVEPANLSGPLLWLYQAAGAKEGLAANLWLCSLALIGFTALRGIVNYFGQVNASVASESMAKDLRQKMYEKLQSTTYRYHVNLQNGDIMQRCTSDIETFINFLGGQLPQIFHCLIQIAISLVVLSQIHVNLMLLSFLSIPLLFITAYIFFRFVTRTFTASELAEGHMSTILEENIGGMRIVRAFATQKQEIARFKEASEDFFKKDFFITILMSWFWGLSDFLCQLQIGLTLVMGTVFAVRGELSVGSLIVFVTYTSNLIWPIRDMGRVLADMGRAKVAIGRIREVLSQRDEPVYQLSEGQTGPIRGNIKVENLNYAYDTGVPVLKDVSFEIKAGQTVAILGRTGSGKSTLLHILVGLLPYQEGHITVDGMELNTVSKKWLRKHFGVVLQEPFLYSKTIRENVGVAKDNPTHEDIRRVTEIASIYDGIQEFKEGFDTIVGERGVTLSGGQKQRIAIARTLMMDCRVYLFDDSLSAVDVQTDAHIRDSLRDSYHDATKIIVAHRINTLKDADQILVMDDGRIVDRGTHEELIARPGLYQDVYQMQSEWETTA